MSAYKKMLVAIDLTEEAPQVLNKAKAISEAHGAELMLVHVVEPVGYAYGGDIPMDLTELQDQLDKAAREQLGTGYGEKYDVGKEQSGSDGRAPGIRNPSARLKEQECGPGDCGQSRPQRVSSCCWAQPPTVSCMAPYAMSWPFRIQ